MRVSIMSDRFSATLMEHFLQPRNRGRLEDASGIGVSGTPGAGPFFLIRVLISDNRVADARFDSHNCGVTVACGSVLTSLVKGLSVDEARELTPEVLEAALDGVPVDKKHVPILAINTLLQAIVEAVA